MDEVGIRRQLAMALAKRRLELGKTRQDVERESPIATGAMTRFEQAERLPTLDTLCAMSVALACKFVISADGIELITKIGG